MATGRNTQFWPSVAYQARFTKGILHGEFAAWFTALIKQDPDSATQVAPAVAALPEEGRTLDRPLVDRLNARHVPGCHRDNVSVAEQLYMDHTADEEEWPCRSGPRRTGNPWNKNSTRRA